MVNRFVIVQPIVSRGFCTKMIHAVHVAVFDFTTLSRLYCAFIINRYAAVRRINIIYNIQVRFNKNVLIPPLLVFSFDNEFIQILEILASRYNFIVVFGVLRRFDKIYCPLRFGTTIFRIGHFDLRPKTVTDDMLYTEKRYMRIYR